MDTPTSSFFTAATPKPATPKRKLKVLSIATKYQAIKDVESGMKNKDVAAKYEVPCNTISTWCNPKNKEKIKASYESSTFGPKTKRMRTSKYQDVESAVDMWFKEARAADVPVSGPLLMSKADELAKGLGYTLPYAQGLPRRRIVASCHLSYLPTYFFEFTYNFLFFKKIIKVGLVK
jgi:hypothetical protein